MTDDESKPLGYEAKLRECGIELRSAYNAMKDVDLCLTGTVVDNGVGPWEVHGRRGFHHHYEFEVDESSSSDEASVEWDEDMPFHEDNYAFHISVSVESPRPSRNSHEGDTETYDVSVSFDAVEFEAERLTARYEHELITYWHCKATYAWRVIS